MHFPNAADEVDQGTLLEDVLDPDGNPQRVPPNDPSAHIEEHMVLLAMILNLMYGNVCPVDIAMTVNVACENGSSIQHVIEIPVGDTCQGKTLYLHGLENTRYA